MLHALSDDAMEVQLLRELVLRMFLDLGEHDQTPDAWTVHKFREELVQAGAHDRLLGCFNEQLIDKGFIAGKGQLVDATLVPSPRPRLSKEEAEQAKLGKVAKSLSDNPNRLRQTDLDSRTTVKTKPAVKDKDGKVVRPGQAQYLHGNKNHINIDARHGFIRRSHTSHAASDDSNHVDELIDLDNTNKDFIADGAYQSRKIDNKLKVLGLRNHIQKRKPRGKKMPSHIARGNRTRARRRMAVEHEFSRLKGPMGLNVRSVGKDRASFHITLANVTYNMLRLEYLTRGDGVSTA